MSLWTPVFSASFGNTEQDERRQSFTLFEFRPAPVFRSLVAAIIRLQVIMTDAKDFISNNVLHILILNKIKRNSAYIYLKNLHCATCPKLPNTCKHLKTEGVFVLHWGEEEKI